MSDETMTEMSGDGITVSMARVKCTLPPLLVRNLFVRFVVCNSKTLTLSFRQQPPKTRERQSLNIADEESRERRKEMDASLGRECIPGGCRFRWVVDPWQALKRSDVVEVPLAQSLAIVADAHLARCIK